ncbi:phage tail protein [Mesorhizobium cantuariense]|uniref:Phage tail protein n=1 Tax=Mesorhizobium cantuariense TaxID=1300275 RepID=A0ABV7MZN7_9HYPH
MGTPFLGELKLISWNFAPKGWALCNGQLLPINQNQALFSLLGTNYGGDGRTTFGLPDLRSRVPIHIGGSIGAVVGGRGGAEFHTLTLGEMPAHNHLINASQTQGDRNTPAGSVLAREVGVLYAGFANATTLNPGSISSVGNTNPHENRQPFLTLNIVIALQGIFPSQN